MKWAQLSSSIIGHIWFPPKSEWANEEEEEEEEAKKKAKKKNFDCTGHWIGKIDFGVNSFLLAIVYAVI